MFVPSDDCLLLLTLLLCSFNRDNVDLLSKMLLPPEDKILFNDNTRVGPSKLLIAAPF